MAIYGTLGENNIGALSASISDTAVDIFVYDTRKDSDGGAWRKRTQHTSWYNETLNTATRGSRREFPAVAVIVVEGYKLTIYDGDDPDLPMWMVFNRGTDTDPTMWWDGNNANAAGATYAFNGLLMLSTSNAGSYGADFIGERSLYFYNGQLYSGYRNYGGGLVNRNSAVFYRTVVEQFNGYPPAAQHRDVAITALPNAPIDSATGLPVPTIAVATDGGVSVIKDDGSVYDIGYNDGTGDQKKIISVKFSTDNKVFFHMNAQGTLFSRYVSVITADDQYNGTNAFAGYYGATKPALADVLETDFDELNYKIACAGSARLSIIDQIPVTSASNIDRDDMVADVTSSYNTGWMHGDIKGAFLSDTDATNVTDANLVSNGDFSSGATGWADDGSGGTNSFTVNGSGQAVWSVTTGTYWLNQQVYLTPGKTYTIQAELISSNNNRWIRIGSGPGGTSEIFDKMTWVSNEVYQFTVPSNWTNNYWVQFGIQSAGTITFDNVILKLAEEDRSVNNNGLQVFGTITKSPVAGSGATAAELVAYSGFSNSTNYLQQPTNTNLPAASTDVFSLMSWINVGSSLSNNQHIFGFGNTGLGEKRMIYVDSTSGEVAIGMNGGNTSGNSSFNAKGAGWINVCFVHNGSGNYTFYLNGREEYTVNSSGTLNTAPNPFILIGVNLYTSFDAAANNTSIALARLSSTRISPEQIKKIYEDEKVLFQENAACTLYGSSDAVTALAYDDSTSILYAGTSSGRSDFQGLRRINNTTTAVTTAMSASNGLVAEQ